jgi:hypothetical protein
MKQARIAAKPQNSDSLAIKADRAGKAVRRGSLHMSNTRRPRSHVPNTRDHPSASLSLVKAVDLGDAAEHAVLIGLPLNVFVTIHFEAAALRADYRAQDAIGKFLKLAGQWLGTQSVTIAYIWALEHATGTGEHVHILLHCPPWCRDEFEEKAKGVWMEKAGMLPKKKRPTGIKIERVGPRGYHPKTHTGHDRYDRQLFGVLCYHLKGLDPDCKPANDNKRIVIALTSGRLLPIQPEHSNAIYGRRCSRSENISAKARDRYRAQLLDEAS